MTSTTEAGRALLETVAPAITDAADPTEEYVGAWYAYRNTIEGRILAIEAEAIAAERERIRTAATAVAWLQDAYIIEAMNGERRHPRTPADWVEAYRAAVLAIIDGEATDD